MARATRKVEMNYIGKLYGKVGRKYFNTGKTTEDWDKLERELAEAKDLLYKAQESINSFRIELEDALGEEYDKEEFSFQIRTNQEILDYLERAEK